MFCQPTKNELFIKFRAQTIYADYGQYPFNSHHLHYIKSFERFSSAHRAHVQGNAEEERDLKSNMLGFKIEVNAHKVKSAKQRQVMKEINKDARHDDRFRTNAVADLYFV